MSKRTFILLNEKSAWIGSGTTGPRPAISAWTSLEFAVTDTVETLAAAIADVVQQHKFAKRGCAIILSPQYFENRPFQVPPVGLKELPSIVHMLAKTQFSQATDESIVDFAAMPMSASQGTAQAFVAATTMRTNRLLSELKSKGISFDRILTRATASGILGESDSAKRSLCINILNNEIDFSASKNNELLVVRTSQLPGATDAAARHKSITREVARTVAVLAAEYGHQSTVVQIAASAQDADPVKGYFAEQEDYELRVLDVKQLGDFSAATAAKDSSFDAQDAIALLAIAALHEGRRPLLCFANPTKPPREGVPVRKYALVGGCVLTAFASLMGMGYLSLNKLDKQIAQLQQEIAVLEVGEPGNVATVSRIGAVNEFVAQDSDGLRLIDYLSQSLPYGDKYRVKMLNLNAQGGRRGESEAKQIPMTLTSLISDKELVVPHPLTFAPPANWKTDPIPTFGAEPKSDYYTAQVTEDIEIVPDFEELYDHLDRAFFQSEAKSDPAAVGLTEDPSESETVEPRRQSDQSSEDPIKDEPANEGDQESDEDTAEGNDGELASGLTQDRDHAAQAKTVAPTENEATEREKDPAASRPQNAQTQPDPRLLRGRPTINSLKAKADPKADESFNEPEGR